jgi:hypothetical protein
VHHFMVLKMHCIIILFDLHNKSGICICILNQWNECCYHKHWLSA